MVGMVVSVLSGLKMEIDFPLDSNGKCINFSSLWYKFTPNFSLDNQSDICRASRTQGKGQQIDKVRNKMHS